VRQQLRLAGLQAADAPFERTHATDVRIGNRARMAVRQRARGMISSVVRHRSQIDLRVHLEPADSYPSRRTLPGESAWGRDGLMPVRSRPTRASDCSMARSTILISLAKDMR